MGTSNPHTYFLLMRTYDYFLPTSDLQLYARPPPELVTTTRVKLVQQLAAVQQERVSVSVNRQAGREQTAPRTQHLLRDVMGQRFSRAACDSTSDSSRPRLSRATRAGTCEKSVVLLEHPPKTASAPPSTDSRDVSLTFTDFKHCGRDRFSSIDSSGRASLIETFVVYNTLGSGSSLVASTSVEGSDIGLIGSDLLGMSAMITFATPAITFAAITPARVLVYVSPFAKLDAVSVSVNGHALPLVTVTANWTGWASIDLAGGCLSGSGHNSFTFSSEHGKANKLFVDTSHRNVPAFGGEGPHSASMQSYDGGATWRPVLCDDGSPGELMVRLVVNGHNAEGTLTSPVLDLADPGATGTAVAPQAFGALQLHGSLAATVPKGTSVRLQARMGSTAEVSARTWGVWSDLASVCSGVPAALGALPAGVGSGGAAPRFGQWRCVLATASTALAPTLTRVELTATVTAAAATASPTAVSLVGNVPPLARSEWQFAYMMPHPKAMRLKSELRLDTVVEWAARMKDVVKVEGNDDFILLCTLRTHVHSQWLGWQIGSKPFCPAWDALEVLATTKGDWGFGMCDHYSATFVGAAGALGFHARSVCIGGTHGGGGHCIAEAWVPSLRKWVIMDTGPSRDFCSHYTTLAGLPLSALEMSQLVRSAGGSGKKVLVHKTADFITPVHVQNMATCPELQSLVVDHIKTISIPSRADYTLAPELAFGPGQQGYGGHTYGGLLHFLDTGAYTAASHIDLRRDAIFLSARAADLYPSIGECRLYFTATGDAGKLDVLIEGSMPALASYEYQVDGKSSTVSPVHDVARIEWVLHTGANALAVRAVSRFGRAGPWTEVNAKV